MFDLFQLRANGIPNDSVDLNKYFMTINCRCDYVSRENYTFCLSNSVGALVGFVFDHFRRCFLSKL